MGTAAVSVTSDQTWNHSRRSFPGVHHLCHLLMQKLSTIYDKDCSRWIASQQCKRYECISIKSVPVWSRVYINITQRWQFIKCNYIPEMRKDRINKVNMVIDSDTHNIVGARCGCPAGKGPCATCKHVGGLCYALEEYCRLGRTPDYITCTEKLQKWNKPWPKRVNPFPVASLTSRRKWFYARKR